MLNLSTGWKFVIYGSAAIQYSYPQVILFYESLCYIGENHFTSNRYFLESLYDIAKHVISLHNFSERFVTRYFFPLMLKN